MNQNRMLGFSSMTPVVKNLIILNVIFFVATFVFENSLGLNLYDYLGLHYFASEKFHYYQFFTYIFMHGGITHILFNMVALWMFGNNVEALWGPKKFITFYLVTGFGAGLLHYGVLYFDYHPIIADAQNMIDNPNTIDIMGWLSVHKLSGYFNINQSQLMFATTQEKQLLLGQMVNLFIERIPPVVGASGSLFGILLAYGMLFPDAIIMMIFLPIPIKAKYFVMLYGAAEIYSGLQNNPGDNVAHFAHIGGMVFGYLLIKTWEKGGHKYDKFV